MRIATVLSALGVAVLAAPAAAEIPVSPLGDIYESYNDCLKVADPGGLSKGTLASLGWQRATMSTKDGKPIADGPIIYGNAKRKPIILLSAEQGKGACIVMARVATAASFGEFLQAWGGKLPAPDKDGVITFFDEGRPVQIRQTGSADKPALTMAVMTPSEKK